jgi:peroxiredoxin (alkyl hydroperoxide reductase subunit C)
MGAIMIVYKLEVQMSQLKDGCVTPAKGPILPAGAGDEPVMTAQSPREVKQMRVEVGKEAIDFEASAFIRDYGFKPVRLSDYRGKWIIICFYPGDFTFV